MQAGEGKAPTVNSPARLALRRTDPCRLTSTTSAGQAFSNIDACLRDAGMGFGNVVMLRIYLTDRAVSEAERLGNSFLKRKRSSQAVSLYKKLLVIDNGAYGNRIAQIAQRLRMDCSVIKQAETEPADPRPALPRPAW